MGLSNLPEDLVGARIGKNDRFLLERVIGEGSSGSIWLARDDKADRHVAVKLLQEDLADDPIQRARFVREGRRFASLRHTNLVRVHQLGAVAGRLFIVIEYVEGRNIHDTLVADGPFEIEEALRICSAVASGLHEAHEHKVIHRDLKPANIMIRAGDRCVKVLDFGIAKDLTADTALTMIGSFIGTPAYSAPEQIRGGQIDRRADIYALGVIFYELLAGPLDLEGRHTTEIMRCTLRQERVPLNELFELVTRPVARLIQRMTRTIPDRRPESMEQVVQECNHLLEVVKGRFATEDGSGLRGALKEMIEG